MAQQMSGRGDIKKKSPYESISANKQILLNNNSEVSLHVELNDNSNSVHDNYYIAKTNLGTNNNSTD